MNWYKLAKLELILRKSSALKDGILATLLSILSGISLPYETQAIRKFLDERNVDPKEQQEIVSTINKLTYQNKGLNEISIDDVGLALETAGRIRAQQNSPKNQEISDRMDVLFEAPSYPQKEKQVATGGPLDMVALRQSIKKHEGKRNRAYLDPSGKNWSIGYGFNLNKSNSPSIIRSIGADYKAVLNRKQTLSDSQIERLLDISIKEAISVARDFAPNYDRLSPKAKLVLVDMAFMGRGNLNTFEGLREALIKQDYGSAANEMLDSLWSRQVGRRARQLAEIMESA